MARSEDPRAWVRMSVDLPSNSKLEGASTDAKWLWVVGVCVSGRDLSDGIIRPAVVVAEADVDAAAVDVLVERGAWHQPGHTCAGCPQPPARRMVIHDYLKHQQSREEVAAKSAARSAAGRRGAQSRWGTDGNSHGKSHGNSHDDHAQNGNSHGNSYGKPNGKPIAESETEPETDNTSSVVILNSVGAAATMTTDDLEKIRAATGGTIPQAAKTARLILSRTASEVRNPLAYVLHSIGQDPAAFKIRRGNPKRGQECVDHPGEWADACRQHALDLKLAGGAR